MNVTETCCCGASIRVASAVTARSYDQIRELAEARAALRAWRQRHEKCRPPVASPTHRRVGW